MTHDRLFELHARICKTLSNPWRLRIIDALRGGERSVTELAAHLGISRPNLSQHLGVMQAQGVVEVRREGAYSYYRLTNQKIVRAFELMREVLLERLSQTGLLADELAARANPRTRSSRR